MKFLPLQPINLRASSNSYWGIVCLGLMATLMLLPAARATSIPPAEISVSAEGGVPISTAGTVTGTGFNPGPEGGSEFSTASASFAGGDATVSGNGSTSGGVAVANSSGSATLTFFFKVEGSETGVNFVPLIFTGSDSTSATGPDAEATGYFETPGGQINSCSQAGLAVGHCGTLPSSNSGTLNYDAGIGVLYDMQVQLQGGSTLGSGSWSASVDPQVQINPSFQYASDFSLIFSPNVVSATPEPSTLCLLGIGLLGLLRVTPRRVPGRLESLSGARHDRSRRHLDGQRGPRTRSRKYLPPA